jgi:protein O-mannosyl-transferase
MKASRRYDLAICAALLLGTAAAFWPVSYNGFVSLDDPDWVTDNPHVLQGITPQTLRWATFTYEIGYWHPLTWYSHLLDVELFGLNAAGHHWTSVILHAGGGIFLFLALMRMTGSRWRSAFVAALFAWHPLRVESVAWVAERKDVLSTFFMLAAIFAYALYAQRPNLGRYLLVALLFVLGCMAKPMVVTLPCVLLLLDYWPLRRLQLPLKRDELNAVSGGAAASLKLVILEKLPLLSISIVFGIITIVAQRGAGAVVSLETLPISLRLSNAAVAYATYLWMAIWPRGLSAFYPHAVATADHALPVWRVVLAVAVLILITLAAMLNLRRRPYLIVGWLWYLGTAALVIGIIQVGSQSMADRYTYVPMIGIAIAAVWLASELVRRLQMHRPALITAGGAVLLLLVVLTWRQTSVWRNDHTLAGHALKVDGNNYLAHDMLAGALLADGHLDEAIFHYENALAIYPSLPEAHNNLGNLLAERNQPEKAIEHYRAAISLQPGLASAQHNLALLLAQRGQLDPAIDHWRRAVQLEPSHAQAHQALAIALTLRGDGRNALQHLRAAAEQPAPPAQVLIHLAWLLATHPQAELRNPSEAAALAQRVQRGRDFHDPLALDTLAAAQAQLGQFDQAIESARQARDSAARLGQQDLAARIEQRIAIYARGETYVSGRLPGE